MDDLITEILSKCQNSNKLSKDFIESLLKEENFLKKDGFIKKIFFKIIFKKIYFNLI